MTSLPRKRSAMFLGNTLLILGFSVFAVSTSILLRALSITALLGGTLSAYVFLRANRGLAGDGKERLKPASVLLLLLAAGSVVVSLAALVRLFLR